MPGLLRARAAQMGSSRRRSGLSRPVHDTAMHAPRRAASTRLKRGYKATFVQKQHSGQLLALCGARIGAEARARRSIGRGHGLARRNQAPPAAAARKRVDSTSRARPTGPTRTSGAGLRTRRGRGGMAWGTPGRVWGREGAGAGVNLCSYFWALLSGWYWPPVADVPPAWQLTS